MIYKAGIFFKKRIYFIGQTLAFTNSKSTHLLRVWPRVHVHQHGVLPVLVKVVGEVQPDLGVVSGELALDLDVLRNICGRLKCVGNWSI